MLRNRSVLALARLAEACFRQTSTRDQGKTLFYWDQTEDFADLLFEKEYPTSVEHYVRSRNSTGGACKAFILGAWRDYADSAFGAEDPRGAARERHFVKLAQDLIEYANVPNRAGFRVTTLSALTSLVRNLELDGYELRDARLVAADEHVLNVEETGSLILRLCQEVGLATSQIQK